MRLSRALSIAALGMVAACAPAAPLPSPPPPVAPPPATIEEAPPLPAYVLDDVQQRWQPSRRVPLAGGLEGAVVEGRRVVLHDGEPLRVVVDSLRWRGGAAIPARLGGGVLLWTDHQAYRAGAFEAPAVRLAPLLDDVSRLEFGPDFVLVSGFASSRAIFRLPSGDPAPARPLGIVDVAALDSGRALALTIDGKLLGSRDGGHRWDPAPFPGTDTARALHTSPEEGTITVETAGDRFRFDEAGTFTPLPRLPPEPSYGDLTPRAAAVREGTPAHTRDAALVMIGSDVVRVDLRTGARAVVVEKLAPERARCQLLRAGEDLLAICQGIAPEVRSGLLTRKAPTIERTFKISGRFLASEDGALLFEGPCGEPRPGSIACARDEAGSWTEHELPKEIAASVTGRVRWIPRRGAPPAAVLEQESGARLFVPGRELGPLFHDAEDASRPLRDLFDDASSTVIDEAPALAADGSIAGYARGRGFHISADGALRWGPPPPRNSAHHGRHAIGFDAEMHATVSRDFGDHWEPTAAPPLSSTPYDLHCGELGCAVGPWLRLDWSARPPSEPPPAAPMGFDAHDHDPPRPELACATTGAARSKQIGKVAWDREAPGLGARTVPGSTSLRSDLGYHFFGRDFEALSDASLSAQPFAEADTPPPFDLVTAHPRKLLDTPIRHLGFVEPFDAAGPIRQVKIDLRPALAGLQPAAYLDDYSGGASSMCPLLLQAPADGSGLVAAFTALGRSVLAAVSGGARPRVVAWGLVAPETTPISAVELPGGDVAVLVGDRFAGPERVVRLGKGSAPATIAELRWALSMDRHTPNPPALALGPGESLSILITPSGAAPATSDDPAIAFPLPDGPPVALAPWASILDGAADGCSRDNQTRRAIILADHTWVNARGADALFGERGVMRARVRWSESRACAEALEVPREIGLGAMGHPVPTIVVRFPEAGKNRLAGEGSLLAIGLGEEARQPVRCSLGPAQPQ